MKGVCIQIAALGFSTAKILSIWPVQLLMCLINYTSEPLLFKWPELLQLRKWFYLSVFEAKHERTCISSVTLHKALSITFDHWENGSLGTNLQDSWRHVTSLHQGLLSSVRHFENSEKRGPWGRGWCYPSSSRTPCVQSQNALRTHVNRKNGVVWWRSSFSDNLPFRYGLSWRMTKSDFYGWYPRSWNQLELTKWGCFYVKCVHQTLLLKVRVRHGMLDWLIVHEIEITQHRLRHFTEHIWGIRSDNQLNYWSSWNQVAQL